MQKVGMYEMRYRRALRRSMSVAAFSCPVGQGFMSAILASFIIYTSCFAPWGETYRGLGRVDYPVHHFWEPQGP